MASLTHKVTFVDLFQVIPQLEWVKRNEKRSKDSSKFRSSSSFSFLSSITSFLHGWAM